MTVRSSNFNDTTFSAAVLIIIHIIAVVVDAAEGLGVLSELGPEKLFNCLHTSDLDRVLRVGYGSIEGHDCGVSTSDLLRWHVVGSLLRRMLIRLLTVLFASHGHY